MFFAKDFPDKIRATILTSEIVSKKVKLKQRGKDFLGLCPFHNEKTPSFTVNDEKGFYHCFGCGEHGDIISFKMQQEGLEFKDAVIQIAEEFGIEIPYVKFDEKKEDLSQRKYLLQERICQFFEDNLKQNKEAKEYLKSRNLSSSFIKKFRLGYAKDSFNDLSDFLKKENFSENEILASGVIGKNSKGGLYDKFRNRVIFPICDRKSNPIAFGGRTIGDDMPKYLNSAETSLFIKNRTLYNLDKARKSIFDQGQAIVVEGYMDAIALSINGIKNVVAGLGTALGSEHLKELFRITDKIIICLDGDLAGIKAAKRVSQLALPLINAKKNIHFAILPNQMDPDDFLKEFGTQEFNKFLQKADPLSGALFQFALMDLKIDKNSKISAEHKAKIENYLEEKLEKIADNSSKRYFSYFFKDMLFYLGRYKNNKSRKVLSTSISKANYVKKGEDTSAKFAKQIIAYILFRPELLAFENDIFNVKELCLASDKYNCLKDLIIELVENNEENLLIALENSDFSKDIKEIKKIMYSLSKIDLEDLIVKFLILLINDLLIQVEEQYQSYLNNEDYENMDSILINKENEIRKYKGFLEKELNKLINEQKKF